MPWSVFTLHQLLLGAASNTVTSVFTSRLIWNKTSKPVSIAGPGYTDDMNNLCNKCYTVIILYMHTQVYISHIVTWSVTLSKFC